MARSEGISDTAVQQFEQQGFVTIPGLLSPEQADAIVAEVEPLYRPELEDGPRSRYRAQDAWSESPAVRALACRQDVLDLLQAIYGRRPFPFQTLNFRTGSEQRNHSDSIHFNSMPRGFMCGVWVALEDTDASNGPLFYVEGSHRLPDLTLVDLGLTVETADYTRYEDAVAAAVAAAGLKTREVHVPKGTGFIWSASLVHGGMPVLDPQRTRHSQVTHYFFDECVHYTPFYSELPTGELLVRTPTDLTTGRPVTPSLNGRAMRIEPTRGLLSRLRYETADDRALEGVIADFAALGKEAGDAGHALLGVYQARPDLQAAFGGLDALDLPGLIRWSLEHGLGSDDAAVTLRAHEAGLALLAERHAVAPTSGKRRWMRR